MTNVGTIALGLSPYTSSRCVTPPMTSSERIPHVFENAMSVARFCISGAWLETYISDHERAGGVKVVLGDDGVHHRLVRLADDCRLALALQREDEGG